MKLKRAISSWIDEDSNKTVFAVIARLTAGRITEREKCQALQPYVDAMLVAAYEMGVEKGLKNTDSQVPPFQSMVNLQIEKIKAAEEIIRSHDNLKALLIGQGELDFEFSDDMTDTYTAALEFLKDQMKGDEDSALEEENQKLKEIRSALNEYHKRLKNREHGGVAQDSFVKTCEKILGMNDEEN